MTETEQGKRNEAAAEERAGAGRHEQPTRRTPKPQGGAGGGLSATAKRVIAAVVAVVVLAGVGVGAWLALNPGSSFFDPNAQAGQAPYKTPEEIQAELDRVVEEGMFNISIASVIEFADGTAPGTAYIENVPGNRYAMKVALALDDTGEAVYESGGIAPGNYIESVTLSRDLDAGTYPATATFTAFDKDTLDEIGKAAAKVTLVVRG